MFLEELGLRRVRPRPADKVLLRAAGPHQLPHLRAATSAAPGPSGRAPRAPQAAGKIHSDFERGFIRAEIVAFDDLEACGSMAAAKEKGLVRSEGKDYVMKDGDVTLFRFNV